jgi:all-trans-retinol 13,14-reductase
VGLHYIGQVHDPRSETRRVFDDITDGKLRWAPMPDVYDRVLIGDRAFDLVAGGNRLRKPCKGYFPQEARAIARYLETVRHACEPA